MNDSAFINLQYTALTDPLPDFIYEGLKEYSRNANGYRPQPIVLIERLAKKFNHNKESIYLTAGADEAIQMLAMEFGKKAFIFTPTYVVYNDMTDFYANVARLPSLQDNTYQIATNRIHDATLIYLANPNNPFGFTTKEKILELVENNPRTIIVVDEVYAEFADLSVMEYVNHYSNLVVLRSFSISYAMAGNRIGYMVANPEVIQKVKSKTQRANVSYLAVGAAMVALDHESYFQEQIEAVKKRRDTFEKFLIQKGLSVLPSMMNALLIQFASEEKGTQFATYLAQNKIVISHGNGNSNVGLDASFVRISIGNEKEMEMVKIIIDKHLVSKD